ncbi:YadA-like family protein [Gallibacterium anatis]|uniref:YadA-like family protein n=2 Tax=Gallibacterium anatis TaxID=750 RepID=UPI0039FCA137
MNKIYKVIFNRNKNRYEIVSELASSRGGKCKVKAGKQIAKLFMTGLLATFLSSVALAADEEVKVKYDATTGMIKIVKVANESEVLATYAVGGSITPIIDNGETTAKNTIALGQNSTVLQSNTIAIGTDAHAGDVGGSSTQQDGKIAIGTKTVASGDRSIALGNKSATNNGSYTIVQGNDSIGIGTSTSVFGYSGVSIGRRNIIGIPGPELVSKDGVLTTKSNTPYREADPGGNSVIVGAYNVAYGNRSSIVGTYSRAMGSNSVAIGSGVQSLSDGSIAIGKGSGYEFEDGSRKGRREKEFYGRDWELPPEYKVLKQVLSNDIAGDEQYKGTRKGITWENGGTLPKYNNYGAGSSDPGGFIVEGKNALGIGTYTQVRGDSAIGLATGEMTADLSDKDKSAYAKDMRKIMDMEEVLYEAKEKLKPGANNGDTATLERAVKDAEESLSAAKKDFRKTYLTKYSFVDGDGALGVGRQILAQGDRSMAVGDYAKAISSDAIAYGGQTLANGTNSMAMGGNAHVGKIDTSFDNSMAIGSHTNVQAGNAVALGAFSEVTGQNSLALGFGKQSGDAITYNSVSGKDSTLIGSYGTVKGNNSILIGSNGNIANDRVVGLGNNINIKAADQNDQENNTAGSVFLGDHAGYVKDSKRSRSLGQVDVVGSAGKMELTESLSSTKGALRDYTKDFIYIYMLERQDDGTQIGAPIAVRSDFAGGDSTVGVVSVGSTYEQNFSNLEEIKKYHTKVGSLITVPVEVTVQVTKNGVPLGEQQQIRYFAADSTQEEIYADSTLSQADKAKVWNEIQSRTTTPNTTYTVFETRRIQNVAPGLIGSNSTDAINGSQLFATNQMLGNLVGSLKKALGDNVTITPDGQIDTKDEDDTPFTLGWIAKAGSVDGSNGTVSYEVDKAEDETEEANKAKVDNLKSTGYVVDAAKTMTFKAGKNIGLVQKPGELSISTVDTPSFTSVELRGNETTTDDGKKVTEVTKIDSSGMKVVTETSIPASDGGTTPTVTEKVSTTVGKDGVSTDGSVKVTNGTTDLVTIDKGTDDTGTDKEYGKIGLDGKNGSNATITVDRGAKSLNDDVNIGVDPSQPVSETNESATMDRITYTTTGPNNTVIDHEVATMDDGLFFSGDSADGKDGNVKNKFDRKLSQETKIVGGVDLGLQADATAEQRKAVIADKLTDGNIGVISDGTDTLTVKLAKQLTGLDSTTYTSPTTKTGDGDATSTMKVDGNGVRFVGDNNTVKNDAPSLTTDGITGGNKTITDVASGIGGEVKDPDKNNANTFLENVNKIGKKDGDQPAADAISENVVVNAKDLKNLVDTGFKLNTSGQGTAGASTVKIGDTIKVVDGANTKVSAIDDSTTGTHTFHIDVTGMPISYTDNQGNALTKIGDKYYKNTDIENGKPKTDATEVPADKVTNNIKVINKDGTTNNQGTISNVKSVFDSNIGNGADTGSKVDEIKDGSVISNTGSNQFINDLTKLNDQVDPKATNTEAEKIRAKKDEEKLNSVSTVRDLQKVALTPLFFEGDVAQDAQTANTFDRKLSEKTKIVGEVKDGLEKEDATAEEKAEAIRAKLSDGNIGVVSNGTDTLTIKLAKNLVNLTSVETGSGNNKTKMTENGVTTTVKDGDTFKVTTTTPNGLATTEVKLDSDDKPTGESTTTMVTTDGVTITTQTPPDPDGDKPASTTETKLSKDGLATDGTVKVTNGKTGDDAKDLVTIGKGTETDPNATDKEFGTVAIDGKNGSNATLTVDRGTKSVTDSANVGKDPTKPIDKDNPAAGMDRLTYTTTTGIGDKTIEIEHQVATLDDGFFLTTEHTEADKTRTVLFNNTIKVLDGANTKVSAMGGEDGTHTFSIDVTGLPMTYTATDANGKTQDVHKVGDTYTLADGTKLVQVGDKFYKPDQVEEVNGTPQVKADQEDKDTKLNNISLTSPVANTAPTLSNVGSALKKSDGTRITMSNLDDSSVYPTNNPIWNNAVNVGDLKAATDAARTEVTGTGEAFVTNTEAKDGHTIYNVHVDKILSHKDAAGNELVRGGDGKYYTNEEIKDKTYIPSENKWYSNRDITDGKPNKDAQAVTPNPVDQSNVKTSLVNPNTGVGTGTDTSMTLDNVKSGIGGDAGNGIKDGTTVDGTQGNNTFIKNLDKVGGTGEGAIDKTTVVNAGDLKNLADTPLFFQGDVSSATGTNNTFSRKLSEKVSIVGEVKDGLADTASAEDKANAIRAKLSDGNIGVVSNGTDTLTIKLAKELQDLTSLTTIDKTDGTKTIVSGKGVTTDGKVVVNNGKTGDDAKDLVTIGKGTETDPNATDKEFGTVAIDGKNGSNATLTVDRGTSSLDDTKNIGGTDPKQDIDENNPAKMDRITYTTKNKEGNDVTHEVATMDDGFFLTTSKDVADDKAAAGVKLNHTIKFTDGANTKVSTVTSKDGVHELHIDVTGLPMTYTVSQTGGTDAPVSVSKVGDTYQLADGTKLVKVNNKFYKPSQLEDSNADQPQVRPEEVDKNWTVNDSISLVNKDGSNNAPTLKNVGSGLKDANGNSTTLDQAVGSNAVNVDDLRTLGKAATTEVTGTGAAEVTKVTGADGQNIYNVHVDKLMTVKPVDANTTIARGGDGKYYNADNIAGKTFVSDGNGGGSWYNASDVDAKTGKPLKDKSPLAEQPIALDQSKLKNSVVNPNGDGATIVDNVKSGIGGEVKDTSGKNTFIKKLEKVGGTGEGAIDKTTVVNAGDLKNLADTPLFFQGDVSSATGTNNTFSRKLSEKVSIVGEVKDGLADTASAEDKANAIRAKLSDGNIGVVSNGTDTLTIKLAKNLVNLTSVETGSGNNKTKMTENGITTTVKDGDTFKVTTTTPNGLATTEVKLDSNKMPTGESKTTTVTTDGVTITTQTPKNGGKPASTTETKLSKDGLATDGTVKVTNGKTGDDAKDLVTIGKGTETDPNATDKEFGTIAIDGKNGSKATLTVDRGTKSVTDKANILKDPKQPAGDNNPVSMDRLTYTTTGADGKSIINHEVATLDDGFFLTTSTDVAKGKAAAGVKLNHTIKFTDGANTKVSTVDSKDGIHELHVDVTGLPMTYTVSQTSGTDAPVSVSKVGDTYQLADGTKLVKVDDKFYKPSQLVDPKADQPQVRPEEVAKDWTVNDSISLVNKDGSNNAPTLKNVGSGLKDAAGKSTSIDQAVGSNAVNVDDLRTLGKAATTEVTGTGAVEVTKVTGANGQNIYNVHVERFMQVAETDVEGNKVVKAADNYYYKEADIKDKTYIDGQWYNNTDIEDKTKIGDKWYSNTEITDGKANPGATELTVKATTPNKAVGLQNNLVNPNDNTPTRLSNLASALSGEVGNGANPADNSAINGIDKNGKPTSESGNNTFVKNVLDLDATEKTVEQLKTSLGHEPSEDEVKAEKARAEKDKALLNSAVTVADLQKTLQSPLFFEGDSADGVANENDSDKNTFARKLSQKTKIVGGVDLGLKENAAAEDRKKAIAEKLTDHNIGVISNGTDTLTIKLAKDLTGLNSSVYTSLTPAGNDGDATSSMKLDGNGIRFFDGQGKAKTDAPSLTTDGIKGGNKQITDVADGLKNDDTIVSIDDLRNPSKSLKDSSVWTNAVNVKDLKKLVDAGFKLNTSGQGNAGASTVKIGETINVVNGANTKVSAITPADDGTHTFHIDVTGLPVTYTATKTDANGAPTGEPVDVSKVGDGYQLADGTKLEKAGDKYYTSDQLKNGQPKPDAEGLTIKESVSLTQDNGAPATLERVGSGRRDGMKADADPMAWDKILNPSAADKAKVDNMLTNAANIGDVRDAIKSITNGTGDNATGGFGLTGNNGDVKQDLGKTITVKGGIANKVDEAGQDLHVPEKSTTDKNTYVNVKNNEMVVEIAKDLIDLDSVTVGSVDPTTGKGETTKITGKDVTIKDKAGNTNTSTATKDELTNANGDKTTVEAGNVNVSKKDKDGNTNSTNIDGSTITLENKGKDGKTTVGSKTDIGTDGIKITYKDDKGNVDPKKDVSLTDKGLNNGGNQIKNVGSGLVNKDGNKINDIAGIKDQDILSNGVNVGDLQQAINSVTNSSNGGGFGLTGNNGDVKQDLGKTITIIGGIDNKMDDSGKKLPAKSTTDKNTYVNVKNNEMVVEIAKDLTDLDSVTVGSDKDGKGETTKITGKDVTIKDKAGNTNTSTASNNKLTNANGDKTTVEAGNVNVSKKDKDGNTNSTNIDGSTITLENKGKDGKTTVGSKTDIGTDGIKITYKDDKGNVDPKKDVSLTDKGLNNGGNQIKNVGSGLVDKNGKDITDISNIADSDILSNGVNVKDLQSVNKKLKDDIINISNQVDDIKNSAPVVYLDKEGNRVIRKGNKFVKKNDETVEILPQDIRLSLVNADGKTTNPSTLQNVAKGVNKTDAVNVEQLKDATEKPLTFNGDAGSSSAKLGETVAIKGGANSADLTDNNIGVIADSTTKTLNVKLSKKLKGLESAEFVDNNGNTTNITGDGVHISGGNGSNVSLTSQGLNNGGNRITNVAPGVEATDAVNVSQLNQVGAALHNRINNVAKGAYGGVASAGAMASLPQAYLPGKSMVAAGASHYRGESAVALGASRISDNGKIILKLNASHNTSGNTMVGAGVGYQF